MTLAKKQYWRNYASRTCVNVEDLVGGALIMFRGVEAFDNGEAAHALIFGLTRRYVRRNRKLFGIVDLRYVFEPSSGGTINGLWWWARRYRPYLYDRERVPPTDLINMFKDLAARYAPGTRKNKRFMLTVYVLETAYTLWLLEQR